MVTKISLGKSLYGALAYNGEKINKEQGRLLATNRIFNDGSGTVDIAKAMEGFLAFMPATVRTEKPVLHISINPHPDDVLTDTELQEIAREYLDRLGYGNQPYMVCIRKDLERKYGLHSAERRGERIERPLCKVDVAAGDIKKQVGNIVKAVNRQYRFQSLGEYRALLSLYNVTVEEARGIVRGREYHGLVFSATDDAGNKTGNPFKSSLFGKSAGYDALQNKFARSKKEIKDRKLAEMTKRTVLAALEATHHQDRFIALLRERGIDTVLRHTEDGRIYGATFIDHRTGCVLNGSRMGRELSANALQEHFTLPYANEEPITMTVPAEESVPTEDRNAVRPKAEEYTDDFHISGAGLFSPDGSTIDPEEEAFIRAMQRKKKKKKRKGLGM